jgi:fructokinase
MSSRRIGVDLGGTKIEVIVLDESRTTLLRERVPTPAGDYSATVRTIVELIRRAQTSAGSEAPVGIGTPGAPSKRTGLVINANSTVLIGKPLREDIERAIGRGVHMTNDANCFVLSEALDGAAAGASVVFGVILGTGVGGGIAVGGRVIEGTNGIAGEWGHNPLPWPHADELPGPACYCGKHGCIETFLSGPALARECAETGDEAALQRYEDRLARALASVINILDPDAIVLGGGVSNVARLYDSVPALLPKYVFSDAVRTPVLRALHGDSSGVRGAAMLESEGAQHG